MPSDRSARAASSRTAAPRRLGARPGAAHGFVSRWVGVALALIGVVATVWLALTGQLELYIHPRYTVFTVVMAIIGGTLAIAALLIAGRPEPGELVATEAVAEAPLLDEHGHDHGDEEATEHPTRARLVTGGRVAIVAVAATALLVLPPATLSATTLQSRDLTTSGQALESTDTAALIGGDTASFSVKDWASLLRQAGPDAVLGQEADLSGYVLDTGEDDVFYLARMTVTCCAVDAQPVGVPVFAPDWRDDYDASTWVQVTGVFGENPDASAATATVLQPRELERIEEPAQPYVF